MKKVFLLLVGILSLGMFTNKYVVASEGEQHKSVELEQENSASEVNGTDQIESDGEIIKLPENKQRNTTENPKMKAFELKRYFAQIKNGSSGTELVPMPNTDFKISYLYNGKDVFITDKGKTNEKGEILGIPSVEIPAEVTSIRVWYYLGNEDRGYIQKIQ